MTNKTYATPTGPTWKQALLFSLGGGVLAYGGCAAFDAGFFGMGALAFFGGLAFVVGVVMCLIGIVLVLIRLVRPSAGK